MNIDQMQQAMGSAAPAPTGKTMSIDDMSTIMNGGTVNHQQAAAALGHSTNMLMDTLKGFGKGLAGELKGGMDLVAGGMAQTIAGPVLGSIPGVKEAIDKPVQALKEKEQNAIGLTDENLAAQSTGEKIGKGAEFVASLAVPFLDEAKGGMGAGKVVKAGISDFMANRYAKRVASTAETMTKGEREAAVMEGRKVNTITRGTKYLPSESEQRAGKIIGNKTSGNPIKNVKVVQNEIASRGKEAEQFTAQNARPVDPSHVEEVFASQREKASEVLNETEMKNYDQITGQFFKEWDKLIRNESGSKIGTHDTGTLYKGLKNFEDNITARLPKGKEALLTDSGSAKLEAAKQVRHAVRDLLGELLPEYKGKMYDLSSLYDALDNVVSKAEQEPASVFKRYPKTVGAAGTAAAIGADKLIKDTTGFGF